MKDKEQKTIRFSIFVFEIKKTKMEKRIVFRFSFFNLKNEKRKTNRFSFILYSLFYYISFMWNAIVE